MITRLINEAKWFIVCGPKVPEQELWSDWSGRFPVITALLNVRSPQWTNIPVSFVIDQAPLFERFMLFFLMAGLVEFATGAEIYAEYASYRSKD